MTYQVPDVWEWKEPNDNRGGNRPTAGARFDFELPIGEAPIQLYSLGTPNGKKVTIMLEELKAAGHDVDYDLFKAHIGEGDQFGSDFVAINPNSKIPAMMDHSHNPPLRLFESGSILVYLAEKFGAFLPEDIAGRTETLNWLFWQMGAAPYVGGGFGHFFAYAPEKFEYAIDRFSMETKRQLDLLDQALADCEYIVGDSYTIADIAIWPWYGGLVLGDLYEGSDTFLNVSEYPNLIEWAKRIQARPGVQNGVNAEYKPLSE